MRFAALGRLRVLDAAHEEVWIRPGTATRLLCMLLATAPDAVDVDVLCERLWWGRPPPAALATVRANVHWLRRVLGPDRIGTARSPAAYSVRVLPGELDIDEFVDLAARGQQALRSGDPRTAFALYEQALALWRGRPFDELGDAPDLANVVRELEVRRVDALGDYADAGLELGMHTDLLPRLVGPTVEFPSDERFRRQLMLALFRSGRGAEAVDAYEDFRTHLSEEYGTEPSNELRELHYAIARRDPKLEYRTPAAETTKETPKPAQLPPRMSSFTGRNAELATLSALANAATDSVVIAAVDGMAGVGKSVLTRHAGHLLADQFPDGQLFLDLHGYTAGVAPVDPLSALERGLSGLGVPSEQLPHDLDARTALWRSHLAGKRFLLVLDNARSEEQVRPLLPSAPGCMALVTGRRRLVGLEEAHHLSLGVLPPDDAAELFRRIVGAERLRDEPLELVATITQRCGQLPLAIRIIASRFATRPSWRLSDLLELLDEAGRLGQLEAGTDSVSGAFELSFHELTDAQRRLFRLLGLHPGADFDAHAAAALTDLPLADARKLLEELVDIHLLETQRFGRYRFHDLLRSYARALVTESEPEATRTAAVSRHVDFVMDTAVRAMALYNRKPGQPEPSDEPAGSSKTFADGNEAVAWLDTERANLVALAAANERTQHASEVLRLAALLEGYTYRYGFTPESLGLEHAALRVARRSDDRCAEALVLARIGAIHTKRTQFSEALRSFAMANELVRQHDDDLAAARVHEGLGHVAGWTGRYPTAAEAHLEAAERYRRVGNLPRCIVAVASAGLAYSYLGQFDKAAALAEEALAESRAIDNLIAEGFCHLCLGRIYLDSGRNEEALENALQAARRDRAGRRDSFVLGIVGAALRRLGRLDESIEQCERIVAAASDVGDGGSESMGRLELGRTLVAAGKPGPALEHLNRALELVPDGARHGEASIHHALGDAHLANGDLDNALGHYEHARAAFADMGTYEAAPLAAQLADVRENSLGAS